MAEPRHGGGFLHSKQLRPMKKSLTRLDSNSQANPERWLDENWNNTINLFHNLDFGRYRLVAARTLVNFIARAILPLIFSFPFMNACCGFSSLRTILIMSLSETFTDRSGLDGAPPAPPAVSLPADGFSDLRSRYHCSLLSEIVNTTLPCTGGTIRVVFGRCVWQMNRNKEAGKMQNDERSGKKQNQNQHMGIPT